MTVIRRPRDGAVLVSGNVHADGSAYERQLGGHIEFGERAADAARREIREEIGQELRNLCLLGVIENLITSNGTQGHEVVFVFEADLVDQAAYEPYVYAEATKVCLLCDGSSCPRHRGRRQRRTSRT